MPSTINGIGTHYYGRSNVVERQARCEHCGGYYKLKSYDTWYCFCIVFIPVLPLGKKRIVDECPGCTKHYAMPLAKWEEGRKKALAEVTEKLQNDPENPQVVREAVGVAIGYQDGPTLEILEQGIHQFFGESHDMLFLLGQAWDYFGNYEKALQAFQSAHAVNPEDEETKVQLGLTLLDLNRPAEAEPYLRFAVEERKTERAILPVALAETYDKTGNPDKAMDLLDEALAAFPELESNPVFRNTWKTVSKHVSPDRREQSHFGKKHGRRIAREQTRPWLVAAVIAVLVVGGYLGFSVWKGYNRTVYVVNGLPVAYRIELNGEQVQLPPLSTMRRSVAEGEQTVRVLDDALRLADTKVDFNTSVWTRPFDDTLLIINPDRTALLDWERAVYTSQGESGNPPPVKYHIGKAFYRFDGIDFPFGPFPKSLSLDSNSSRVYRERIGLVRDVPDEQMLVYLHDQVDKTVAVEWAKTHLLAAPDNMTCLVALGSYMPVQEYVGFIRSGLDAKPVRIQWHRTYQDVVDRSGLDHDLTAEYRKRLANDPDNPALLYLAGRVTVEPDEMESLFRNAMQADPPSPYAANALAFLRNANGRFKEALALAQQAVAMAGKQGAEKDASFDYNIDLALAGLGRWQSLLERCVEKQKSMENVFLALDEAKYRLLLGQREKARATLDSFVAATTPADNPAAGTTFKHLADANYCYVLGDREGYADAMTAMNQGNPPFAVLLTTGNLAEAAETLGESDQPETYFWLLVMIAATRDGDSALADTALANAVAALAKGTQEERRFAAALQAETRPDPAMVLRLAMQPAQKRTLLAAMGARWPEDRKMYFLRARALNFDRSFPYLFLQDILDGESQ